MLEYQPIIKDQKLAMKQTNVGLSGQIKDKSLDMAQSLRYNYIKIKLYVKWKIDENLK